MVTQNSLFNIPAIEIKSTKNPKVNQNAPGFIYKADFITVEEETRLLKEFKKFRLNSYKYKGYNSKRRVKSFTRSFPAFLFPILERVAKFAKVRTETIRHAMITEYSPNTAIGWHRDQLPFDKIIGISFGAPCIFRLRKKVSSKNDNKWIRSNTLVLPRSIYIMSLESRWYWQHSIPKVEDWRYSLTIRTVEKRSDDQKIVIEYS